MAEATMITFASRFLGALALSAATFEDVEKDRRSWAQAGVVVGLAVMSAGLALGNLTALSFTTFAAGVAVAAVGWAIWIGFVVLVGTRLLPESRTRSDFGEVFRTFAFATAPGTVLVFAAIRPVAWFVLPAACLWMIAATAIAARQSLDFRSTGRAVAVCTVAWIASFGSVILIELLLTQPVR